MLLLLAAGTRIWGLDSFPVWTDEGWTVWASERVYEVIPRIAEDRHPPLYFGALALWQEAAGMSRPALRMLSVFSGLITAAILWRVGRRVFDERTAVIGVLLFAIMPVAVYYTREIRHFGWLLMTVSASSWAFLRVLHRPTLPRYTLYAVSVALIMYTLYMGFFVIIAQVIAALFVWRGSLADKAKFIGAWALALGLFAPWLFVFLRYQLPLMSVGIAGSGNVTGFAVDKLYGLLRDTLGNGLPLLIVGWGLAAMLLVRRWRTLPNRVAVLYVLMWGVGMFVLMAVINASGFTLFRVRTITMLIPGFVLLAGWGLASVRGWLHWVLVLPLIVLTAYRALPVQPRVDYPPIAAYLGEHYIPGDLIVVETGWQDDAFLFEMRNVVGWDADVIRTLQWVDYRGENKLVVLEVEDRLRAAERIWVIHWNQPTQVASWLMGDHEPFELVEVTYHPVGRELEVYEDGYFARVDGDIRLFLFAR